MAPTPSGKKRSRNTSLGDLNAEKKQKPQGDESASTSNDTLPAVASPRCQLQQSGAVPPTESMNGVHQTPVLGSKFVKEAEPSPYMMTARKDEGTPTEGTKPANLAKTPAKLVKKLEAVKEQKEGASEKTVVVHRSASAFFCAAFFLFLWIGSSALLGGLWLAERLEHNMDVWKLRQELMERSEKDTDPEISSLLVEVEIWKVKSLEAEYKLSGFKSEFQEQMAQLEEFKK
jgi:hypothetical protein